MGNTVSILIADDEQNSRELLVLLLTRHFSLPHHISEISDQDLLSLNPLDYDLVFVDAEMPFASWDGLINRIHPRKTQVVLCTAYSGDRFKNNLKLPVYYLQKPVDPEIFKTILEMITQRLKAQQNSLLL